MDIDSTSEAPESGANIDIEQSLLQQFSCMGTTDRDELIAQLQKVLGAQLNSSTAAFFLDMNNWNLQGAICSYFDVENSKLPTMLLESDSQASDVESVEPNTSFTKRWTICNYGNEPWPMGCYAQCTQGDSFELLRIHIDKMVYPGERYTLEGNFVSPSTPGTYQSKWRLCTPNGSFFGDPLWLIVSVVDSNTIALSDQLSHLNALGSSLSGNVNSNPFRPRNLSQSENDDSHMS